MSKDRDHQRLALRDIANFYSTMFVDHYPSSKKAGDPLPDPPLQLMTKCS